MPNASPPSKTSAAPSPEATLSEAQISAIVASLKDHLRVLADADPATKATLFANLGLSLTYHPNRQTVSVEADVSHVDKSVSEGGLSHLRHAKPSSTSPPEPAEGFVSGREAGETPR